MLKGVGISDGIGLGKVVLLKNEEIKPEKVRIEDVELEKKILYNAIHLVEKETEELVNQLSGTEKDIIQAYLMILQDPTLVQSSIDIIEQEKCNNGRGFDTILEKYENEYVLNKINYFEEITDEMKRILRDL